MNEIGEGTRKGKVFLPQSIESRLNPSFFKGNGLIRIIRIRDILDFFDSNHKSWQTNISCICCTVTRRKKMWMKNDLTPRKTYIILDPRSMWLSSTRGTNFFKFEKNLSPHFGNRLVLVKNLLEYKMSRLTSSRWRVSSLSTWVAKGFGYRMNIAEATSSHLKGCRWVVP